MMLEASGTNSPKTLKLRSPLVIERKWEQKEGRERYFSQKEGAPRSGAKG